MKTSNTKLDELDPVYLGNLITRIEDRLMIMPSGCWEWTMGRHPYGYGKISVKGKAWSVHRTFYQLMVGFIPDDIVIDHICKNPPCANPKHLEPVTQWENNRRGSGLSSKNLVKTHCDNGHEFTKDNTIIGDNRRSCRACKNNYTHRRDIERTLEYHRRGFNSKGKPMKRKIDYRF